MPLPGSFQDDLIQDKIIFLQWSMVRWFTTCQMGTWLDKCLSRIIVKVHLNILEFKQQEEA